MKAIKALTQDVDWGDPTKYDLLVQATGEKLERKYVITPKPKSELPKEVQDECNKAVALIKLDKLYLGEDPFSEFDSAEWNPDNLPKKEEVKIPGDTSNDIPGIKKDEEINVDNLGF